MRLDRLLLLVETDESPVKLLLHVIPDYSLFIYPLKPSYLVNLTLKLDHGLSGLEQLYRIENLITQGRGHALHEGLHLRLCIKLVIDVVMKVRVLKQGQVLCRESLLKEWHEVWVLKILAHMLVPLYDELIEGQLRRVLLLL